MDSAGRTDEELMQAVQAGDVRAFEQLYARYTDLVFSTALRVLADPQLAEDAAQDVFLRLWRHPERYDATRGKFISWLLSVVRNRAVDEIRTRVRRQKREVANTDNFGEDDPNAGQMDDPLIQAQLAWDRRAVRGALATIPPEQRLAIELAYFGGLTQQEISVKLGEPLGTIKTRMRLGMQKLRRALHEYAGTLE